MIKAECAICRCRFDRILFNVKTGHQYKHISVPKIRSHLETIDLIDLSELYEINNLHPKINEVNHCWFINFEEAPVEFRIKIYKNKWYASVKQICYYTKAFEFLQKFNLNQSFDYSSLYITSFRHAKNTSSEMYLQNEEYEKNSILDFIHRELHALDVVMSTTNSCYNPVIILINLIKYYN